MVPSFSNEVMRRIFVNLSTDDLRRYREVSKNWCRIITPIAFQAIRLKSSLKGAYGLHEILQSEQFCGYVRELVLVLHVDSAVFKGACRQAKLVH
jgi:hypothetical protein